MQQYIFNSHLNLLGKLIRRVNTKRSELSYWVEFKNDFNWARGILCLVLPADPPFAYKKRQDKKKKSFSVYDHTHIHDTSNISQLIWFEFQSKHVKRKYYLFVSCPNVLWNACVSGVKFAFSIKYHFKRLFLTIWIMITKQNGNWRWLHELLKRNVINSTSRRLASQTKIKTNKTL